MFLTLCKIFDDDCFRISINNLILMLKLIWHEISYSGYNFYVFKVHRG